MLRGVNCGPCVNAIWGKLPTILMIVYLSAFFANGCKKHPLTLPNGYATKQWEGVCILVHSQTGQCRVPSDLHLNDTRSITKIGFSRDVVCGYVQDVNGNGWYFVYNTAPTPTYTYGGTVLFEGLSKLKYNQVLTDIGVDPPPELHDP